MVRLKHRPVPTHNSTLFKTIRPILVKQVNGDAAQKVHYSPTVFPVYLLRRQQEVNRGTEPSIKDKFSPEATAVPLPSANERRGGFLLERRPFYPDTYAGHMLLAPHPGKNTSFPGIGDTESLPVEKTTMRPLPPGLQEPMLGKYPCPDVQVRGVPPQRFPNEGDISSDEMIGPPMYQEEMLTSPVVSNERFGFPEARFHIQPEYYRSEPSPFPLVFKASVPDAGRNIGMNHARQLNGTRFTRTEKGNNVVSEVNTHFSSIPLGMKVISHPSGGRERPKGAYFQGLCEKTQAFAQPAVMFSPSYRDGARPTVLPGPTHMAARSLAFHAPNFDLPSKDGLEAPTSFPVSASGWKPIRKSESISDERRCRSYDTGVEMKLDAYGHAAAAGFLVAGEKNKQAVLLQDSRASTLTTSSAQPQLAAQQPVISRIYFAGKMVNKNTVTPTETRNGGGKGKGVGSVSENEDDDVIFVGAENLKNPSSVENGVIGTPVPRYASSVPELCYWTGYKNPNAVGQEHEASLSKTDKLKTQTKQHDSVPAKTVTIQQAVLQNLPKIQPAVSGIPVVVSHSVVSENQGVKPSAGRKPPQLKPEIGKAISAVADQTPVRLSGGKNVNRKDTYLPQNTTARTDREFKKEERARVSISQQQQQGETVTRGEKLRFPENGAMDPNGISQGAVFPVGLFKNFHAPLSARKTAAFTPAVSKHTNDLPKVQSHYKQGLQQQENAPCLPQQNVNGFTHQKETCLTQQGDTNSPNPTRAGISRSQNGADLKRSHSQTDVVRGHIIQVARKRDKYAFILPKPADTTGTGPEGRHDICFTGLTAEDDLTGQRNMGGFISNGHRNSEIPRRGTVITQGPREHGTTALRGEVTNSTNSETQPDVEQRQRAVIKQQKFEENIKTQNGGKFTNSPHKLGTKEKTNDQHYPRLREMLAMTNDTDFIPNRSKTGDADRHVPVVDQAPEPCMWQHKASLAQSTSQATGKHSRSVQFRKGQLMNCEQGVSSSDQSAVLSEKRFEDRLNSIFQGMHGGESYEVSRKEIQQETVTNSSTSSGNSTVSSGMQPSGDTEGVYLQKCLQCSARFSSLHELDVHLLNHIEMTPYKCSLCSCAFASICSLKKHMRQHAKERRKQNFDPFSLLDSPDSEKEPGSSAYKCPVCSVVCPEAGDLLLHVLGHNSEKPYQCFLCFASFKRAYLLDEHVKSHPTLPVSPAASILTGGPPGLQSLGTVYRCSICSTKCSTPIRLKMHMILHAGETPFTCLKCSAGFATEVELRMHKRVHAKSKKFQCFVCSAKYRFKSSLKHHFLKHLRGKPIFTEVYKLV